MLNKKFGEASVSVMNSYDYNNYTATIVLQDGATLAEMNEARKQAQRLVDEAIRQKKLERQQISEKIKLQNMLENEQRYLERLRDGLKEMDDQPELRTDDTRIKLLSDIHQTEANIEHYAFLIENFKNYDYEDEYEIPF